MVTILVTVTLCYSPEINDPSKNVYEIIYRTLMKYSLLGDSSFI